MSRKSKEAIIEEKIGYKQPPKSSQFRKGVSGNTKGRPKGSKNLRTILKKELEEKMTIQEKGKTKKITKQEAIIKTLVNNTLKGDKNTMQALLRLITNIVGDEVEVATPELHAEDMEILKRYMGNTDE
ncbi:MAG: DUF5681 domain-containing protein [Brevinemataceae bacterium]